MVAKYSVSTPGVYRGCCALVDGSLRLKGINHVVISRRLRVQPQAIMGSGLVN